METNADLKWRGVRIVDLDDDTLRDAYKQALEILAALIIERQRRGLWSKK